MHYLSSISKDNDPNKRLSYLPLTCDNLLQQQQQQQQNTCVKGDIFSRRCYDSLQSTRVKQVSHESLLTGSSSSNSSNNRRSSRLTENIMIDMLPLPFPYHNDDIFIPAAEFGLNQFDSPSSSACNVSSYRRISYPVWWHEYGNHSKRQSEASFTVNTSTTTVTYTSSPTTSSSRKSFSKRIRSWCHHAWKRLLHPAHHGGFKL